MKIEITDETADSLMRDMLVKDYGYMLQDIKDIEKRKANGKLEPYTEYDLENNKMFAEAFETLLKYYLPFAEANALIKEMRA